MPTKKNKKNKRNVKGSNIILSSNDLGFKRSLSSEAIDLLEQAAGMFFYKPWITVV